jgi:hypothetical protein
MVAHNPALLDSTMHKTASFTYLSYLAGISHSSLAAAWHVGTVGTLGASFTNLGYGSFDSYDEEGEALGTFGANELTFALHYSRELPYRISVGASLGGVVSQLERYSSYGMTLNIGARYHSADGLFNATLALKNMGTQITPYRENNYEKLPFEIQLCVAHRFERAPFGIAITLNDLQSLSVYNNTQKENSVTKMNGEEARENVFFRVGKELMSHLSLGAEIVPSKYFYAMVGYSYRRNNELALPNAGVGTGFSFGLGITLKYVELCYARAVYHAGAATNHFGIVLKLNHPK